MRISYRLGLLGVATVLAAAAAVLFARSTSAAAPLLDRAALGRSVGAVVEEQMRKFDLPGAAVVVVHGGEVVHLRGYGYADVEARRPFDAESPVSRTALGFMEYRRHGRRMIGHSGDLHHNQLTLVPDEGVAVAPRHRPPARRLDSHGGHTRPVMGA